MSIFLNINFFRDYEPPSDYKDFLWAGILGFVVGDAAGLPFDGMRREELANLQNKKPELIGYKQHFQPPGTWSDNSALLFATMQSLYDYNLILNPDALMQNYCSWMESCKFTATGEHINSPASVLESCELYGRGKAATLCGMNHNHTDDCGNFSRVFPLAFLSISEDKMFSAAVMISGLTDAKDQQVLLACLYLAVARRLISTRMFCMRRSTLGSWTTHLSSKFSGKMLDAICEVNRMVLVRQIPFYLTPPRVSYF